MRSLETANETAAARQATASVETLESRQYSAADHDIGINVNDNSTAAFAKAVPVLNKLGVNSVRLWYGVDQWSDRTVDGGLKRAIDYHNAGFDVTLTIAIDNAKVPDPGAVKSWFKWASDNDTLRKSVDRWEIGNEVDADHYFKGTLKQYVTHFLKPASQALHANGEKVVSAGVSWNPDDVQEMVGYGMLDMVDAVGFHPYANGVSAQKQHIKELQQIVGGRRPLIATEWNVRGFEGNKTQWAAALDDAYANVRAGFDLDYYYCLFTADTMAGPAGLMNRTTGAINQPFYNSFLRASGGVASSTPDLGTTPGNTASATTARIALYDADTDRVISGFTNMKSGQVVDLAKLPSRHVALVVLPSKNASSVKMSLNGKTTVQNTSPYAYFGDDDGNMLAGALAKGSYTFAATPYTQDNAGGTAFAGRTVHFTVVDAKKGATPTTTPTTPATGDADKKAEISAFALIDAKTGETIDGYGHLTTSTKISLASLSTRSLALVALVDEDTKSVKLTANGKSHVENALPYAFFGDNKGKFATWSPHKGSYSFSALAYAGKSGQGAWGNSLSITLKFV